MTDRMLVVPNFPTTRWMFDCCRIPGPEGLDWSISYSKEGETGNTGHIVVIRKNRFWKINAAFSGRILGIDELERSASRFFLLRIAENICTDNSSIFTTTRQRNTLVSVF